MILLILGASTGLLMVAYDNLLKEFGDAAIDDSNVVAYVNNHPVLLEDYETLLAMLSFDKRNSLESADKARALQRLIDEELLIQQGVAMGLVEQDATVRKAISAAMISIIKLLPSPSEPTEDDLMKFHAQNINYFTTTDQFTVKRFVADNAQAAQRLAIEWQQTGQQNNHTDDLLRPLPSGALSPKTLREYVGPTALKAVQAIIKQDMTEALPYGDQFQVLFLENRQLGKSLDFDVTRDAVRFEYLRRRDEKAMSVYLQQLRDKAEINILPSVLNWSKN